MFQASCGGNHTLIHAEPIDGELAANRGGRQVKASADALPPLKVPPKKVADDRKENVEPFASIIATTTNGNDPAAILIVAVKDNLEVIIND